MGAVIGMRTLLSVFVLLLMTVPPFMNVTAVPDSPDFDESGIRTTQDFKDMGNSNSVFLTDSSDCAIRWFYDDDNVNPAAEVYLKVMGSFYGTQSSTPSLSIYIFNSNNLQPQLKASIVPHEYFANTAGLSNAPQWTYIPLGTKGSLGVKGDEWNSIVLIDSSISSVENVIIRVDWDWPNVNNWDGTSKGIARSYYNMQTSSSACLERSKYKGNSSEHYADELMVMLEYSRAFSSSVRDDGSRESYALIDGVDDKVEKKLWVSAPDYTTWNILYMKAASVGSASPPWSPGLLKLKTCKQYDINDNCVLYPFEMTLRAQFFVFGFEQWGFEYVPSSAFPIEGEYYFRIYKTRTDYTKENVQISLSTQNCVPNCNSRWKWNDGQWHGSFNYGIDNGELMIRFKPIRQWDDGPIFKEDLIIGPTKYSGLGDLSPKSQDTVNQRFINVPWRNTAFYKNDAGQSIKKDYYYGENYGGNPQNVVSNAGDDSDFIFVHTHATAGVLMFGDNSETYDGTTGVDFKESSGFNGDAEWVIHLGCEFTKHNYPANSNYLVMHYSKLHSIHGFKTTIVNDGDKDQTFATTLMNGLIDSDYIVSFAFIIAAHNTYSPLDGDRSYVRGATQTDRIWGEGTTNGDTITGGWDILTVE